MELRTRSPSANAPSEAEVWVRFVEALLRSGNAPNLAQLDSLLLHYRERVELGKKQSDQGQDIAEEADLYLQTHPFAMRACPGCEEWTRLVERLIAALNKS